MICPVRACHLPLVREAGRVFCQEGHSFDVARSGYVNLLQPQERRSRLPGDAAAAVAARRRLHDRGVTTPLREAILDLAEPNGEVLDVGCGDGFYLSSIPARNAHGLDISTPAIEAAAKRYPQCEWIVANADRLIPYADRSFSTILSITARMNPPEFHRVLREDGRLLVAVPAPDDLIELRGESRDRAERTIADFAGRFTLLEQRSATVTADLGAGAVADVLQSIYRPKPQGQVAPQRLTFSLDLLLFQPAPIP